MTNTTATTARAATLSGIVPQPFDYAAKAAKLEIELREMQAAAKSLAVRYHSYLKACDDQSDGSIIVWGEMLLEAQQSAGVNLLSTKVIRSQIDEARARENAAPASRTWNQLA